MEHELWREWSAQMAKAGRRVSEEHGITLVRADDPAMGRYLAKVGLELTMGRLKTGRHDSWSMWEIAAMAMNPDPEITDEVRARCRAVWAEYAAAVGGPPVRHVARARQADRGSTRSTSKPKRNASTGNSCPTWPPTLRCTPLPTRQAPCQS
jgi:hypothetical protein